MAKSTGLGLLERSAAFEMLQPDLLMSDIRHLRAEQAAALRPPRSFKVVNVASGAVLAEATDTRTTIDVLTQIDSIFDVSVYVWHAPAKTWRPLTVGEQRTLWDFRPPPRR